MEGERILVGWSSTFVSVFTSKQLTVRNFGASLLQYNLVSEQVARKGYSVLKGFGGSSQLNSWWLATEANSAEAERCTSATLVMAEILKRVTTCFELW